VIPDTEIWRSAMAMVKRYGDDAMREAGARARELMADGDMDGCTTWIASVTRSNGYRRRRRRKARKVHLSAVAIWPRDPHMSGCADITLAVQTQVPA
jgi:hypothetical protein